MELKKKKLQTYLKQKFNFFIQQILSQFYTVNHDWLFITTQILTTYSLLDDIL